MSSWVSAPARLTTVHCFLPATVFARKDGDQTLAIRAAEIPGHGGVILRGMRSSWVRVQESQRHQPVQRDFVSFHTWYANFQVTADHRLLVESPSGTPVEVEARNLIGVDTGARSIFDGLQFHPVLEVESFTAVRQVIELRFADPTAPVLAWLFPDREESGALCLDPEAAVACFGRRLSSGDAPSGFVESRTFLDPIDDTNADWQPRRSRSCGNRPDPRSPWSLGTRNHDASQPQSCHVCLLHRKFMQGKSDRPCPRGAFCPHCHGDHPEVTRTRRF